MCEIIMIKSKFVRPQYVVGFLFYISNPITIFILTVTSQPGYLGIMLSLQFQYLSYLLCYFSSVFASVLDSFIFLPIWTLFPSWGSPVSHVNVFLWEFYLPVLLSIFSIPIFKVNVVLHQLCIIIKSINYDWYIGIIWILEH